MKQIFYWKMKYKKELTNALAMSHTTKVTCPITQKMSHVLPEGGQVRACNLINSPNNFLHT